MSKKRWTSERKCGASKVEKAFEKVLVKNGYIIKAYREYISKTEYLICKDDVEIEFSVLYTVKSAKDLFYSFERYFEIKKEYETLTAEWAMKTK